MQSKPGRLYPSTQVLPSPSCFVFYPEMNPMSDEQNDADSDSTLVCPWIVLGTTHDVEAWIDNFNRELQLSLKKTNVSGYGICFRLAEGGEIFMHTTAEGVVLLVVLLVVVWVVFVICAATGIAAPRS